MARNAIIEAILAAWYEWKYGPLDKQAEHYASYLALIDQQVNRSAGTISRNQLEQALAGRFREYRLARLKEERLQTQQMKVNPAPSANLPKQP